MPPIEAALIKPVVDALLSLFKQGENIRLKLNAETALHEAIRELLLAHPDENKAETKIAIARAAGIISEDILLAEDMLKKHRATKSRIPAKSGAGRKSKSSTAQKANKNTQTSGSESASATKIPSRSTMNREPQKARTRSTKPAPR
jgi:hypothetical protein